MKVTLSIDDETQLKADLKDMVAGFIKQMAREEAQAILTTELQRILKDKVANISEYSIKDNIKDVLRQQIDKTLGAGWYNQEYVKKSADEMISKTTEVELKKVNFLKVAETIIGGAVDKLKKDFLNKLLDNK